eukprot:2124575-Pyramimonas_sp.AAC.1
MERRGPRRTSGLKDCLHSVFLGNAMCTKRLTAEYTFIRHNDGVHEGPARVAAVLGEALMREKGPTSLKNLPAHLPLGVLQITGPAR